MTKSPMPKSIKSTTQAEDEAFSFIMILDTLSFKSSLEQYLFCHYNFITLKGYFEPSFAHIKTNNRLYLISGTWSTLFNERFFLDVSLRRILPLLGIEVDRESPT